MEEIPSKQDHVHILLFRQAHDFMEALPAVVAAYGVSFGVTNMAISGYEDAYRICSCCSPLAAAFQD